VPLAKGAAKVMAGKTLAELGVTEIPPTKYISIKEAVLPFGRFPEVDTVLGPEMKSTGEVMGIDADFAEAYAKAQMACGFELPTKGKIFISVCDKDKPAVVPIAQGFADLGFSLVSTRGTAEVLRSFDIEVDVALKVQEGRPNVVDLVKDGKLGLIINTPWGMGRKDGYEIRTAGAAYGVPCITTISAARAAVKAVEAAKRRKLVVKPIQDYHTAAEEKSEAGSEVVGGGEELVLE
ncbi:MAG: carbamoyl phosphate synthase large subunit, partial [Actinobacteria bacterium]|nr:carbamoyl phosphate synthase large subunit [Actinomycetota bacterium]